MIKTITENNIYNKEIIPLSSEKILGWCRKHAKVKVIEEICLRKIKEYKIH